jgi:regulator of protease activity HflC (stomatin/prohibitin superfamily)
LINFILVIIGLAVLIIGAIIAFNKESGIRVVASVILGAAIALFGMSFVIIPSGYTGVKTTFGQIAEETLPNGFNWKTPFIEFIEIVNNKQQDAGFAQKDSKIWGETSEKVPVYMADVTVTYQIDNEKSAWIYANVSDYKSQLISDAMVASALKDAAVQFTAEQVTVRSNIEPAAQKELQESLDNKYGQNVVHILKVVINNMDFEDSYNEAINQKNLASKQAEAQAIQNQIEIDKATKDAETQRIAAEAQATAETAKAQGEADAIRIKAEAEAEANRKLSESLTDNVLRNKLYDKWNGELPKVSNDSAPLVSIPLE